MPRKPAAAAPVAAPAVHTPKGVGSQTVIVACRMPVTGIELQCCTLYEGEEQTQTGPRKVKVWRKEGPVHTVVGTSYPRGQLPAGFPDKPAMVAGYALTRGIPRAFWETWLEQNEKDPMVVNRHIFAYPDMDHVRGEAQERKGGWTGFEPSTLQTTGSGRSERYLDPRLPKPTISGITPLQVEETRARQVQDAEQSELERAERAESREVY